MQLEIGEVFSDSAVSGGVRVSDRDGGKALLAGRFEVLFVESLSRLSRARASPRVTAVGLGWLRWAHWATDWY